MLSFQKIASILNDQQAGYGALWQELLFTKRLSTAFALVSEVLVV